MTYKILADDRKKVKAKIEELSGEKMAYTGMPRCAYEFRSIIVNRDGTVEANEEADTGLLRSLVEDGLLEPATEGQEAPTAPPEEEGGETAGEEAETAGTGGPEGRAEEETASPEETETGAVEDAEASGDSDGPIKPSYGFPLSQHRPESICNLVFTIYSKGDILSKATGGNFFVSEALKGKLKGADFSTNADVLRHLKDASAEDLHGLSFTDDKVNFEGFPETYDAELVKAWMTLCEYINKAAISQSRVQARRNEETNEKFAFRTWLTRIGMNGPELKAERALYYRNLTGHTAFRTPEDEEKWKKRQAERREARKASEAALATQENTPEEAGRESDETAGE